METDTPGLPLLNRRDRLGSGVRSLLRRRLSPLRSHRWSVRSPVETIRLKEVRRPSQIERLLERLVTRAGLLSNGPEDSTYSREVLW
jgi:hypothetical protein